MSLSPGPLTTGMSTEKLFNGLRRWSSFPIHRNLADLKDLAVRPLRLWIREPAATNETPGFSSAFLLSVIIRLDGHIRRSLTKEYHVGDDPHVLLGAVRSTGNDRRNGLSDPSECLNCPAIYCDRRCSGSRGLSGHRQAEPTWRGSGALSLAQHKSAFARMLGFRGGELVLSPRRAEKSDCSSYLVFMSLPSAHPNHSASPYWAN